MLAGKFIFGFLFAVNFGFFYFQLILTLYKKLKIIWHKIRIFVGTWKIFGYPESN